MAKGKIKLSTTITPVANASAGVSFTLSIQVSPVPESPFDNSIAGMSPACCFLYHRSGDDSSEYQGVCTVAQFLEYTADSSQTVYRSNEYKRSYTDYNTPVSDQKILIEKITAFYNNLNTYVTSYADMSQSTKTFILPDYTEQRLDSLISAWRTLKLRISTREAELGVKQDVWLPALQAIKTATATLTEAADKLKGFDANITVRTYADSNNAAFGLDQLSAVLTRIDAEADIYDNRVSALSQNINAIQTVFNEFVTNSLDYIPSAEDKIAFENSATATNNAITYASLTNNTDRKVNGMSLSDWRQYSAMIKPVLDDLKLIGQSDYSSLADITAVKDGVKNMLSQIDVQISQANNDIEELKGRIEADKSSLQAVEAQMKQIRPSIDLTNPESAWYFTVNVR